MDATGCVSGLPGEPGAAGAGRDGVDGGTGRGGCAGCVGEQPVKRETSDTGGDVGGEMETGGDVVGEKDETKETAEMEEETDDRMSEESDGDVETDGDIRRSVSGAEPDARGRDRASVVARRGSEVSLRGGDAAGLVLDGCEIAARAA